MDESRKQELRTVMPSPPFSSIPIHSIPTRHTPTEARSAHWQLCDLVILAKLLNLLMPQFSHLEKGDSYATYLTGML